jgi:hypothetical protein
VGSLTIEDLLPEGREGYEFAPFEPCASYSAPMDQIVYLREDVSYRADRVDQFLTILWHPQEERVVGIKLKGIRFLFESLRSIVKSMVGKDISEEAFLPLVGALELALKMRGGSVWSDQLQRDRSTDWIALKQRYEIARGIAEGVTFDPRKIVRKVA